MNRIKTLFSLPLLFALTACGGGGDVAGDVATFSAIPSEFNWSTTCPDGGGGGVAGAVSLHIINGGQPPFRLSSSIGGGLEIGLVENDQFVPPTPSMFNSDGYLVLDGKDPRFAVRATLGCKSDVGVTVLDYHSKVANVSIKVDE